MAATVDTRAAGLRPSATRAGWRPQVPALAALLMFAVVVGAHAWLLPGGRWQGDEYGFVAAVRDQGWDFIRQRLLHWSPRPLSETLTYLYALLVRGVRQPLIAPVLGLAWAGLLAGAVIGLCRRGPRLAWTGLIVAAVLAAFLLGHKVGEMFYWPMAALAYLPALAGITCAAFLLIRGVAGRAGRGRRIGCMAALVLASGSAEVGAMATLCVTGLLGLSELYVGRRRPAGWARAAVWWAIPLVVAAGVLAMLVAGRAAGTTEATPGTAARQLAPSLLTAMDQFAQLLVAPGVPTGTSPADALASPAWWLAVFFAGMAGAWARSGCGIAPDGAVLAPARHLVALALGLLVAAYGSLASAAYQFGVPCCQRHDSFRACLVVLALVTLAALAARAQFLRFLPGWAAPVLLLLGLLPPALDRVDEWRADYRQQAVVIDIRRANWAAGHEPGRAMLLRQSPAPHVVNDGNLPIHGYFDTTATPVPWFVNGVLQFFGKTAIDIAQPN